MGGKKTRKEILIASIALARIDRFGRLKLSLCLNSFAIWARCNMGPGEAAGDGKRDMQTICLFDVDGTLSPSRKVASEEMKAERDAFAAFDSEHLVRQKMVEALNKKFPEDKLNFAIGGQISIDVFPQGWDKRYCLRFLADDFRRILFFGDRTEPGGNDFEIYSDSRTEGVSVTGPDDTMKQLNELFDV